MTRPVLSVVILLLAVFGGTQFYLSTPALTLFIMAYLGLLVWAAAVRPTPPAVMALCLWPVAVALLSALVNGVEWWPVSRLWLYSFGLLLLLLPLPADTLRQAIFWAGLAWPLAWLVGPEDNRNVMAFWPLLFAACALGRSWLYVLSQLALALLLGSRGALGGLLAALVVYYGQHWRYFLLPGLFGLAALTAWRPSTALVRLFYWQQGLTEFFKNILLGVGPGNIRGLGLIIEGGVAHPHAHNFIITALAETGLAGLAGLGYALITALRQLKFKKWQAAALVGVLAHSLVDEPLWWPGPLLMMALIVGSIGVKNAQYP